MVHGVPDAAVGENPPKKKKKKSAAAAEDGAAAAPVENQEPEKKKKKADRCAALRAAALLRSFEPISISATVRLFVKRVSCLPVHYPRLPHGCML